MKIAASITSWLGGVVTAVVGFWRLFQGEKQIVHQYITVADTKLPVYSSTRIIPFDTWVWVIWFIYLAIMIAILIWREISVSQGNKVACGIFTIIFAGILGGILTLCIPYEELIGYSYSRKKINYYKLQTSLKPINVEPSNSSKEPTIESAADDSKEKEQEALALEDIKKYEETFDTNKIIQEEINSNKRDFADDNENKYRYK